MEARTERERSSEERKESKPYLVYFRARHRPKKIVDAEPVLVLAPNAVEAEREARVAARVRKRRVLEVRMAEDEEFRAKAKELLEGGRRLPRAIIEYTELWELVRELKEQTPFLRL